jgi:exodeoxyribonuclease VII small subunit
MDADPTTEPASYRAAADELEQILADLDDDHLDVDVLAGKVRRAAQLIAFCRSRISSARMEVEQIVADLDQPADAGDPEQEPAPATPASPSGPAPGQPDEPPTQLVPTDDDPTVVTPIDDLTATERPGPGAPAGS